MCYTGFNLDYYLAEFYYFLCTPFFCILRLVKLYLHVFMKYSKLLIPDYKWANRWGHSGQAEADCPENMQGRHWL